MGNPRFAEPWTRWRPAARDRTVGVIAAMSAEVRPLLRRMEARWTTSCGTRRAACGRLGGAGIVVFHTGEGARRAEVGIRAMLDRFSLDRLLVLGISGGLSPGLTPGDLIIGREVLDEQGAAAPPDDRWLERALTCAGAEEGVLVSSPEVLCSRASKDSAWRRLDGTHPAAVDLESATFARVATERGIPYLVARVICDPAEESLPLDLNRCIRPGGGIDRLAILRRAARSPSLIASLWGLRQRLHLGARTLGRFADELLDGGLR